MLGRIADYERAAGLAEVLVRDAPDDGAAWLARARSRATFHRFTEALGDLDAAGQRGADGAAVDAEQAAILQAVGCSAEALVLRRDAAGRRPDLATLGALAVLKAERGEVTEAENLFTEARLRYRGVSPFPVAELDFRRGLMWLGERDVPAARAWFAAAVRRVPTYAPGARPPRRGRRRPGHPGRRRRASARSRDVQRQPPRTRTPSPAFSATPAGHGKPSDGASARRAATGNSSHGIRRHSPIT